MNKMLQLLVTLALCLCCLVASGCVVTTYYSGYDYRYAPPPQVEARQLQQTGVEQPWGYRPVFW